MSFLICLVLLPGQRSLSNPEGAGGQSGRSSPVLRSFSMETNTRTHTHNFTHREVNGRQGEAVAILSPAPIQDQGGFKDDMVSAAQVALPCSFPGGGTWAAAPGGHGAAPAQRRNPAFHVGRKSAAGPLAPAGHIAGQKNWEGAWENWLILDWPYFFTAQLVHNRLVGQTRAQWL